MLQEALTPRVVDTRTGRVAPADRQSTNEVVCFSEETSKPRAKARAMAQNCMARSPLVDSGAQTGTARPRFKVPCEKLEPLTNAVLLRFAQALQLHGAPAVKLCHEPDDALFALTVRARTQK